jgi:hypothetical protein
VWYTHGPAKTASFIRSLLESRRQELRKTTIPIERIAVILHDSLTGDILYRRLAGVGKHESDAELERVACAAVDLILGPLLVIRPNGSQPRFAAHVALVT